MSVAANHENDTCFQVGLVMGIADCIFYAGLDEIIHTYHHSSSRQMTALVNQTVKKQVI